MRTYRTMVWLICLASLAGCATGKHTEEAMLSWMGSSIDELIASWGPPDSSMQFPGGKTIYSWTDQRSYTTPTTTKTTVTGSVYQSGQTRHTSTKSTTTGGQTYNYSCEMSFTVNQTGKIIDGYWEGNSCY